MCTHHVIVVWHVPRSITFMTILNVWGHIHAIFLAKTMFWSPAPNIRGNYVVHSMVWYVVKYKTMGGCLLTIRTRTQMSPMDGTK